MKPTTWMLLLISLSISSSGYALNKEIKLIKKPGTLIQKRSKSSKSKSYQNLHSIAFNSKADYQKRWNAIIKMAWLGGKYSVPDLERALRSKEWFMKDAALKALQKVDLNRANKWAQKLISDPALVVRSAAVEVLKNDKERSYHQLFWRKLDSPQNFRGSQSLWVRRQMVEALADDDVKGSEKKFVKLLSDNDPQIREIALKALAKVSSFSPNTSAEEQVLYWKNWESKNSIKR